MTLFPTSAPGGKFSTQLDADSDFIIETVARARAQGRAEGMEEAAKINESHSRNHSERGLSQAKSRTGRDKANASALALVKAAAAIRQAAKKGP